jgi:heat shock protein HslJ
MNSRHVVSIATACLLFGAVVSGCAQNRPAGPPARRLAQFNCNGGERLSIAFDGRSAQVETSRGASVVMQQQPAGSGFWYASKDQAIRGKGGDLTWTRADGTTVACRDEAWSMRHPQIQPPTPTLGGSAWVLVNYHSSDDAIGAVVPPHPERYEFQFEPDGRLILQLDCNRANGRWRVASASGAAGGSLELKGGAMTRAMCGKGAMDAQIARDLDRVRSFTLRGDRLYLGLEADAGVYELRRKQGIGQP